MVSNSYSAADTPAPGPRWPLRTCVGCRERATKIDLLRVVAGEVNEGRRAVLPDPTGAAPGRGAYLHRDPGCLRAALRKRAFVRALRVFGALDEAMLVTYLEGPETGIDHAARPVRGPHGIDRVDRDRNWSTSS